LKPGRCLVVFIHELFALLVVNQNRPVFALASDGSVAYSHARIKENFNL
jgi:hypothetical protein